MRKFLLLTKTFCMKQNWILPLVFTLIANVAISQTFIQDVTVVDVNNQKLISHQTVVIDNGIITAVKSIKGVKIPANADVLNGQGKYLMPGMTDAHVHFFQSGGLYTRPDAINLKKYHPYENEINRVHHNMEDFLHRYIYLGITSVIDVGATYNFLKLRDSLQQKKNLPTVYMTGPLLTTYVPDAFKNLGDDEPFKLVTTIDEAKKIVQEQLPYHPDFIKIWYIVRPDSTGSYVSGALKNEPVIKAIIEESHKNNLKVAVHATQNITAQTAVKNGCDYLVHYIDDEIVSDDFIKLLKLNKVTLCPTLIVDGGYAKTFAQKMNYSSYDFENSNPEAIGSIEDLKHLPDTAYIQKYKSRFSSPQINAALEKRDSIRKVNLKKMSDAGVLIAAGTDAGNIGTQHATSFLTELKVMHESGMSNWQVLKSATITPVKILNKDKSYGSIEAGKIADLILLNENPVNNLDNLKSINSVFKNGQLIKRDSLITVTPEYLAQQQLNAYNARDIEAFLQPYSDSVEIYTFPGKLISKGKESMRQQYGAMFMKYPELHCELKNRIVKGNYVMDHESVTGLNRPEVLEALAVYEVKNGEIIKVYFMR